MEISNSRVEAEAAEVPAFFAGAESENRGSGEREEEARPWDWEGERKLTADRTSFHHSRTIPDQKGF